MPVRGNRGLVGSPERPPSTLDPPQVSLSILSSPLKFKSHQVHRVLPPSFWFTNWRLPQERRHVTYYWSAGAPHTSLVWQDEDTWIQKFHSLLFDSRSVDRIRALYPRHPADSFRLSVVAGVEVSSQSAAALTPFLRSWRFRRPRLSPLSCAEGWAILSKKLSIADTFFHVIGKLLVLKKYIWDLSKNVHPISSDKFNWKQCSKNRKESGLYPRQIL